MTAKPAPTTPLDLVQEYVRERLDDGVICPCCTQRAQVYKRSINSGMARALIAMYRVGGTDWLHKPTALRGLGAAARDESLLRYWGLIEEERTTRPDGGRNGWWRVTRNGADFVHGRLRVLRYARVYDGRCLGLIGERVDIRDCLGTQFNLAALLAGTG